MASNCCGVSRAARVPTPPASLLAVPSWAAPAEDASRFGMPGQEARDRRFEDFLEAVLKNVQRELTIEHRKALDERKGLWQGLPQLDPNLNQSSSSTAQQQSSTPNGSSSIWDASAKAFQVEAPRKQDVEVQTLDWTFDQPGLSNGNRCSPNDARCEVLEEKQVAEEVFMEQEMELRKGPGGLIRQPTRTSMDMLGAPEDVDLSALDLAHGHGSLTERLRSISLDFVVRVVMNFVIISNVFILGAQAASKEWDGWLIVDLIYALFFVAEIVYKVVARGGFLIFCPGKADWRWNLFDLALAAIACFEVAVGFMDLDAGAEGVSALRSMRLVRITRVLKLIPVEMKSYFSDLMMMIDGLLTAVRTLFWSIVLMTLPVYVFALILTETLGAKQAGEGEVGWEFNTMARSMFTSYRCLVGGDCAAMNGTPLFPHVVEEHGWFFGVLFCFTQVLMSFGLFNVITSVYVENVINNAKQHDALQLQRRLKDVTKMKQKSIELIYMLWSENVKANGGIKAFAGETAEFNLQEAMKLEIEKRVFDGVIAQPRGQSVLSELELPPEEYESLFGVFDTDDGGTLTVEEILLGIKELRGSPRRSDVVSIGLRIRAIMEQMKTFEADLDLLKKQTSVRIPSKGSSASNRQ